MRIVGGDFKGRPIDSPKGSDIRPTSDRARESVFNILDHASWAIDIKGASVVDVFAGTGALGFEALSRGASKVTFIDKDRSHIGRIKAQAAKFGCWRDVCLLNVDALRLAPPPRLAEPPCDLVFIDPPYGEGMVLPTLLGLKAKGWIKVGALVVAEFGKDDPFEAPRGFAVEDERQYGAAKILFLTVTD